MAHVETYLVHPDGSPAEPHSSAIAHVDVGNRHLRQDFSWPWIGQLRYKAGTGYAFLTMRLRRIGIRVLAYNKRAIRAHEKCGFIVEGCEREAALFNGTWHET